MNPADFPPFPAMNEKGPHVCEAVRLYMAIMDDLSFKQKRILTNHIQRCTNGCATEFRALQHATRLVSTLPSSAPSQHVDEAILAALRQWDKNRGPHMQPMPETPNVDIPALATRRARKRWPSALGLVAAVLLLTIAGVLARSLFFPATPMQAFAIPANVSWSNYVLHYTQNPLNAQGEAYQVEVYQDLGEDQMHVESTMDGKFDVIVISDSQQMLGEDMMHHIAEWGTGVEGWSMDGSIFDLNALRQDLQSHHAVYLGKTSFQGQDVYQIRTRSGQILLLNMQYLPVNVLTANTPLYKTFAVMNASQIPASTWAMQVPSGFQVGTIPGKS